MGCFARTLGSFVPVPLGRAVPRPPMPLYLVRATDGGLILRRLYLKKLPRTRESQWFYFVFARKLTCKPGRRPFNYFYGADFARKPYVRERRQRVCT